MTTLSTFSFPDPSIREYHDAHIHGLQAGQGGVLEALTDMNSGWENAFMNMVTDFGDPGITDQKMQVGQDFPTDSSALWKNVNSVQQTNQLLNTSSSMTAYPQISSVIPLAPEASEPMDTVSPSDTTLDPLPTTTPPVPASPTKPKRKRGRPRLTVHAPSPKTARTVDENSPESGIGDISPNGRADPETWRAIHREKNRIAAARCRIKMRKHHEDLAVTAQEMERKNRILKTEIERLKNDLLVLMSVVMQHVPCPDRRLAAYVQREADKLVKGVTWGSGLRTSNEDAVTRALEVGRMAEV